MKNNTKPSKIKYVVFAILLAGASYGSFQAGLYWQGQEMEKKAIAHECASLDPKTLEFKWRLPISMEMTMEAMPDVSVKPKKGK